MRTTQKTSAPNTPDVGAGNLSGTTALESQPQSPSLGPNSPASTGTPVHPRGNRGTRKRSATDGTSAVRIFSLLHQLQAVDHAITLDAGLYLVELAALELPTTRADGVDLPLVHIRAIDAKGSPVPI